MAEYFIKTGKQVIIIGRTEAKLKDASDRLGNGTKFYTLDTGDTKATETVSKTIISEHPEVDCLILNAGVQTPLDVNSLDLAKVDAEINSVSNILEAIDDEERVHLHSSIGGRTFEVRSTWPHTFSTTSNPSLWVSS